MAAIAAATAIEGAMRDEAARLARALEWIARLPLCGEPELAGLLGVDEHDARRLTHELVKRGWTETLAARSPELEPRRLAVLRDEALSALAAACGRDLASLAGAVPVRPRDLSRRVASLEISVGVNRLLTDLADDLESSRIAELADARSLPLALSRAGRWWLPGVDGYGCLRSGRIHAPFLVAWDRAAAPDVHRRRRLAGWFAASAGVDREWGREGLPPVLVIRRSARERRVWEDALARRDEAGYGRLDLLSTTREELHAAGPAGSAPSGAPPGAAGRQSRAALRDEPPDAAIIVVGAPPPGQPTHVSRQDRLRPDSGGTASSHRVRLAAASIPPPRGAGARGRPRGAQPAVLVDRSRPHGRRTRSRAALLV